jgi:hypothetical protein
MNATILDSDVIYLAISSAFFAVTWGLVWAFSHLQGGKQS